MPAAPRPVRSLVIGMALTAGLTVGAALGASPASADITRCVGAVDTPGAFACYTSPRFDHIGLARTTVATVPVVCYGVGCTSASQATFVPDEQVGGRFTAVSYLGHTYTVYRPTGAQPYVLTSSSPSFDPVEQVQVLALAAALDAAAAA